MTTLDQKARLSAWFTNLQGRICAELEAIEQEAQSDAKFLKTPWKREEPGKKDQDFGGGTMTLIQGNVFEKGGVNVSTVQGQFSSEFAHEIPGGAENPNFWASGISLVIHPLNPHVPIVHMNTRHIVTSKSWFGGGADLTPVCPIEEDTKDFHQALQGACDAHHPEYYSRFKEWCDTYFYLPHRKEPRGVGGIFYDNLSSGTDEETFEKDFAFTRDVGEAFLDIYPKIVRRNMHKPWSEADKAKQLAKRGRYVEFNLLYDRGTRFGLKTDGNVDAILMSLPPMAQWGNFEPSAQEPGTRN